MKVRGWLALTALAIAIVLAGCSRADPSIIAAAPEATGSTGGTDAADSGPTALEASADPAALKFQQETLNAAAGQVLTVRFTNPAPLPHSWVLVQPGQEAAVNDAAAAKNGDATGIEGVIAASPVLNGNGEATVDISALEPGSYPYICTVPGHFSAGMVGTLTVGGGTAGGDNQNTGGATAGGDNQNAGGAEPAAGGQLPVAADPAALKFEQESLTGKAGQGFQVAFNNPSALQHNWVLVEPGQEQAVADAAAAKNGDPTGVTGVIVGTMPIANSSATVDVPPREAGTYPYICTVPGHYAAGMKGTLTIEP
jgi:uncharacterized cupredoxin-like copper-binding protein